MQEIPLEVLSDATNAAVVRMPGRRFPGIVIQGDSLNNMTMLARKIHRLSMRSGYEELVELTADLNELLGEKLAHYEKTLQHHQMDLPY